MIGRKNQKPRFCFDTETGLGLKYIYLELSTLYSYSFLPHQHHFLHHRICADLQVIEIYPAGNSGSIPPDILAPCFLIGIYQRRYFLAKSVINFQKHM